MKFLGTNLQHNIGYLEQHTLSAAGHKVKYRRESAFEGRIGPLRYTLRTWTRYREKWMEEILRHLIKNMGYMFNIRLHPLKPVKQKDFQTSNQS